MKLFSGKMLETLLIEQRRYSEGLLPEIIKRLINCSGAEVDRLRIPDGDDVWAPGYDGIVSAKVESRYITAGKSVWEFGCSSDSLAKIESDFEKRTENSLDIDKANTTFYLVVPKIWAYAKAISEWEAEHREEWKNVIVYDAAILCDWINSELAVAAWLFEIYDKGAHPIAISSISRAWRGFSKWTDPAFTYVMFTEGREEQRAQLMAYCKERQICCVRADTKIGAYSFCLATLMQSADLFDAAIVVQNEDTYHRLCASCKGTIFLLAFPYHGSIPEGNTTIFCTSREMPKRPDEIDLPPLWKTQFIRALCDMGISHSGAEELYISTHGNLWSLIRKIPGSYACAKPKWVDFSNIELLRPLVLLRYYCTTEESDQRLIAKLANVNYSEIERQYAKLSKLEDSPVKRIGERYLIVNREEAWNALGIDISDDSSKCMFDEIKQLVNRIDSVNWLEQQTITSRFHQLLMNYIFFAETGADQRIIDEQLKTLLDSLGGADSSKLLLDELATIAEAAPVLTITFIEHLIDTQLCEIILSQYQDILHALDVLVEIDDTCVRAGTAIFRICKQSFSAAASTAAGEHLLNVLCLWSGHTALTLEQKKKLIFRYISDDPEWGIPFAIDLISKDSVTYGGRFGKVARKKVYDLDELNAAYQEIASSLFCSAIELKRLDWIEKILADHRNFEPEILTNSAEQFLASDYSPEALLPLHFQLRDEVFLCKQYEDAWGKDHINGLICWRNCTLTSDPIGKVAWKFYKYYRAPFEELLVKEDPYDEEYMQTVERLRTEQLERLRAEHGTDGIISLLAYMEDDSAWGVFLSSRLNEREYSLVAHRASEIEKKDILAGLLSCGELSRATEIFITLPERMQEVVLKRLNRSGIEDWLTSPKMKQIYWQHRWMIDYDEQTYQSLLKYNPGGLLMWIYRCIEQQEMDIQKVFEVLYLINKNKCNIDASLLPMIIRKVDNQFYSDEWAELCVNLYYNGFLKHEYGYFPQCMSRYFFRNPDKLLEKIRGDDALYFEFQWHYRLPSEAFFDIGQLLHWTDVMINASDSDADKVTLVGSILGKAPDGDDGIFPIETVRKLLKIKKNEELTTAVARGKINSLGLRDVEDGKKEREKSDIYKMQARAMEIDYPQTSVILRILANFYERESKRDQISSEIEPLQ